MRAPRAQVTRHLLAGCDTCYARLRAAGWEEERLWRLLELVGAEVRHAEEMEPALRSRVDYDPAFASAAEALDVFFGRERPLDERSITLSPISSACPGGALLRAASDPRFAHPRCCVRCTTGARRCVDAPQRMLIWPTGAPAADSCTARRRATGRSCRPAARAWGHTAMRSVSAAAPRRRRALATAERLRERRHARSAAARPAARAHGLPAHLSGRFQQAIELADDAAAGLRELGETHSLASTMVQKAIASLYAGETEAAVRTLNRAIPLIDPDEQNPHLLLAACHNLIRGYIDLDRPEQALSLYFEARELYKEFDSASIIRLRAGWQEGQLLRDLGHLSAAKRRSARRGRAPRKPHRLRHGAHLARPRLGVRARRQGRGAPAHRDRGGGRSSPRLRRPRAVGALLQPAGRRPGAGPRADRCSTCGSPRWPSAVTKPHSRPIPERRRWRRSSCVSQFTIFHSCGPVI